jgi:DNA gyrase/topoisomerase IV subunit B
MAVKVNQKHEKEIVALNDFEAVRLRPDRHIGQTVAMEEKLQVIRNGKLLLADKIWSPGLNHLIVEILENAIDEAKRCKGRKMKNIWVSVNLDTNEVSIQDEGNGFYKAASKNGRTGKNVVRTAYEELNAGSNFQETENSILGTHGVGAAICNILSSHFEVVTVNSTHHIGYTWKDYEIVDEVKRKKQNGEQKGTRVSFIPSKDVFGNFNWDEEILKTYLSYKAFLISLDSNIKDLQINGAFIRNGKEEKIEVTKDFIPENHISVTSKDGAIFLWKAYEDSCSLSFVNGSKCTGIHQKIVNDWLNNYFDYNLAHHFYETIIILNVPSSLMRFGDQNKTKYSVSRNEIEERIEKDFKSKLIRKLKKSQLSDDIDKEIEARRYNENIKKIKKSQRKSKRKISDKYVAPSVRKSTCYITEGLCLEENTKIFIIRDNEIKEEKLKRVKKNDIVITHNNRFKPVTFINKSIKKAFEIDTKEGKLISSQDHKWLVYDKENKEFYFEKTKLLKKSKHKLVKNYLSFLESFNEIKEIEYLNDKKLKITFDNDENFFISANNKICVYDLDNNKFNMINTSNLKSGDIISKFIF